MPNTNPKRATWGEAIGRVAFNYVQRPGFPAGPKWVTTSCRVETWRANQVTGVFAKIDTFMGDKFASGTTNSSSWDDFNFTKPTVLTNYQVGESIRLDVYIDANNSPDPGVLANYMISRITVTVQKP